MFELKNYLILEIFILYHNDLRMVLYMKLDIKFIFMHTWLVHQFRHLKLSKIIKLKMDIFINNLN